MPLDWVDLNEAVTQAKDMVCTMLIRIYFSSKKEPIIFLLEIHGIEQMYQLIQLLDKMKKLKKISTYDVKNLASFQTLGFEDFKTMMEKMK